ncbi:SGNH/GDSL hydrolase family protein [Streptomyces lateritius]|uniref:SGNH/GDSL hydrolase family protein n=1 Tax=Streptomyces lateritius TaxID=67313 RepID=UPI001C8B6BD3|nr:SGNH/GDSL hydrolase family protein [Streptomyces lateritius]MBX9420898.1 SGNH/GDSL hydrolase family protein [Streptomyces lateritius]
MRGFRRLSVSLTTLAAAAALLVGAGSAQAAGERYVALGDSYSSGVGAGSYLSDSGSCKRSSRSYPALWSAANAPSSFSFVACSGATSTTVKNSQLGTLNSSTTLVSVSAGGNDIGFADIMGVCVLQSDQACINAVNEGTAKTRNQLPGQLDQLYSNIKSRSPQARVMVLGYPRLYKLGSCVVGIGDTKRKALDDAADTLNTVISQRAAAAGFRFIDVRGPFSGHEICSGDAWLHSTRIPVDESYHPNSKGQQYGYLPSFDAIA